MAPKMSYTTRADLKVVWHRLGLEWVAIQLTGIRFGDSEYLRQVVRFYQG